MPLSGWGLARLLDLDRPLAVGLILVACCPGGTASNVISYLARADVALSVTMTSISTVIAVVLTPALTALLAGSRIEVPTGGLLLSTAEVVLLPVIAGLLLRRWLPGFTRRVLPAAPLVSVIFITLIVASVIGSAKEQILGSGWRLIAGVF